MLRSEVRRKTNLKISEIYPTIQGEGLLVGVPSLFIRLQGCNLRCPWCDQPESLELSSTKATLMSLEDILQKVLTFPYGHVVITGGEPFLHKELSILVEELLLLGKSVQIETNGTLWNEAIEPFAYRIHITCSPKGVVNWYVNPNIIMYAKELKFVVDDAIDLDVLLRKEFLRFLEEGRVVLQPEGNKKVYLWKALELQENLLHMGYQVRIIPQVHKLIGLD
ncbi:7-carboxy-7-deazaguanine synthase QueE [Thermocrinis minervae]|uniref:7-carboxy-7-deazaguanine synthase n=1 Tax=Thermocrinis minervae TaxID=381751 RepID=A0A1M6SQF5_9AQUI|nr:7-carboxy-7-deazaguanine synthase QueE [Thermocrinis minervae]SHK46972.1 Organic radical activating enzyme [Thermocrinis minervae]